MHHKSDGDIGKVTGSSLEEDSPELSAALLLDGMAERYGMLPSQVLATATTQDVYIYDIFMSFQEHVRKKHESKSKFRNAQPQAEPVDSPEMLEKLEQFKKKKI